MYASGYLKPKSVSETEQLMQVALGEEKADLAIVNADIVNVYTGEIIENQSIGIKGPWIAYVGKNLTDAIGPDTEVIDAGGYTVIPGLIDGHTHIAWLYTTREFLKHVIPGGTTTVVTETIELYPVSGYAGVVDFLESLKDQPIKMLATAPPMVSISESARGMPPETLQKLLTRDDVIGLGESYWQAVLQEPGLTLPLYEQTLLAGKSLEGHSAGARDKKLAAYVAAGISSCHEPINAEQVLERLRLGLHIMIREGSVRSDLENIANIKDRGIDYRHLILVTDGAEPQYLMEKGYMDHVVQKAIDCGFDPVAAIQMATLNVATHFSIDSVIGGIAPGRYADLVMIPDVNTIDAQLVISNGKKVAQEGNLLTSPREHVFSEESLNSVKLIRELEASDFIIEANPNTDTARIRVIDMVTDLVTAEFLTDCSIVDGQIKPAVDQNMVKVAAVDRANLSGRMYVGLIRGFGLTSGALACSAAWDTSDIIVVGANDEDMAYAVNRIHMLQGGAVVCENQQILVELALPIFGIMSDLPINVIAQKLEEIKSAASKLGVAFSDPLLTLITLTGAAIPYLRICEEGLVNLKDGQRLSLFAD
ncbi:MAG: adenine deaminase C-terminal domain-containing protein [Desulfobacterales bacterium]|jgi:adenine deaminase